MGWRFRSAVMGEEKIKSLGGRRRLLFFFGLEIGLGLGLFFLYFSDVFKIDPPEKNQCSLVFIGKVLLGFQTSPSTFPFLLFSSFFCKF